MSGLSQVLDIGASGLEAASAGMQTVSNNTANVNTAGYNLESINQVSLPGADMPAGGLGAGTSVTSVQRAFDQFIFAEILGANAANQSAQALVSNSQNLAAVFPVVSGGANGLGQALDTFFGGAATVAQDAASLPNRQVLIGDAQSVASMFNSVGNALSVGLTTQNQEIGGTVSQINALASQIAAANQAVQTQAAVDGGAPNSLLDQRDQLIQQLSQDIGVDVVQGNNGSVDIYTAGGAALVAGGSSFQLSASSGAYLDGDVAVLYGPTGQDLTQSLSGGQLGGLLAARAQLIGIANSVGALANNFAAAVNTQQAQGVDLNGNLGAAMFTVSGPAVYASSANTGSGTFSATITSTGALVPDNFTVTRTAGGYQATDEATGQVTALGSGPTFTYDGMTLAVSGSVNVGDSFEVEPTANTAQQITAIITDPKAIAAASPYVVTAGTLTSGGGITDNNAGNVQASIGAVVASGALSPGTALVPAADFGQALSIQFTSPTSFNVVTSGGATVASGSFSAASGAELALQYPSGGDAITVTLSPGTPAQGDGFVLSPAGPGNNGNITALAALASSDLVSGQSLSDFYAGIVSTIGNQGQDAQVASQASQGVLTSAQAIQQSVSGVNLDEQAALLVTYQQAYQASAQVIATAQSLFSELITAVQA